MTRDPLLAPDRREAARDEEILARPARPAVVETGPCADPWCPLATIGTGSPHAHPHRTDPPAPF